MAKENDAAQDGGGGIGALLVKIIIAGILLAAAISPFVDVPEAAGADSVGAEGREVVFVVHGLGRSRVSMAWMAHSLEREGYRVVNWGYSSTSDSIPAIADALSDRVRRDAGDARVHFVGHSLGNILVRWSLAHDPPPNVGRVVMLTPPNQGSKAADRYAPWLGWFLRPLPELETDTASTVRSLPIPARGAEIGIVAGRFDGKVTVDEARLPGASELVVVPAAHSFLMNRADVRRLTARFLRTGSFGAETSAP